MGTHVKNFAVFGQLGPDLDVATTARLPLSSLRDPLGRACASAAWGRTLLRPTGSPRAPFTAKFMIHWVLKMAGSSAPWIGSAYLFLQSTCKTIALPSLYESSQKKPSIFKALKLALADSTGSLNGVDMLKVHCSHPHLIIQLKFCKQENCRRFLQSYREGALQESLQNHLQLSLAMSTVPLEMELKAGSEHLDNMLKDEDRCLECIYKEKPDRLRDEEITELEECLKSLVLHQNINNNMAAKDCMSLNSPSLPYSSQGSSLPSPEVTFKNLPSSCRRNGSKWVAPCRRTAVPCVILLLITWPSNMTERDYMSKPISCFSDLSSRRGRRPQ